MTRRQMVGLTLVCVAVFVTGTFASAATTPDNSNTCPAYGKTAKGVEKRPCRPGSTHKITFGVGGKYTPAVGVQSRCLTQDQEAQYVKDRGATCTVEYCTPAQDGKEKCTKKTVKIDLNKTDPYGGVSPFSQQAQADSARLAAYSAMNDTAAAYRAGNMAKVQEIANQTKANPEVSALINSAFSNIKSPAAGGGAVGTLSDEAKLQAVIASLDPQKSGTAQPPKDVVTPKSDTIAADVTVEKAPKDNANMPCPAGAACDTQGKTATPASTFSPATEANKKTATQPAQPTSWWGSVTNKVSDYLPASVNRWLGLANPPDFRPYDPATDVPLLVKENDSASLKDKLHLDPFDTQSPVVLMNKDVSVSSGETALQAMTKRQSQAVQTADIDPDTPVPSGGIVVTPLDASGKPNLGASQVMEAGTWRDFLNEVNGNDKYNNTVISVNIPSSEQKTETPAGADVTLSSFEDLPASVKEVFQKQDAPNKLAPPQVADNPPPGTESPTLANNTPAGSPQNESPKESPAPPAPQPPTPTVEQSSPPVPTPLPEPTMLPPAPPEKEEQPPDPPKEPPKPEEPKPEEKPVEPPVPVLSSPTKSAESVPTPLPEPELKDKLPTPESTTQSSKEEIEDCKGNIDCRLRDIRKWLDDLERPKEPPKESSLTTPSSPSSLSSLSSSHPRYVPGESSESFQKRVDAWWEQSSNQSLEDFINSRGGQVGQCESCHNPQMGGGAGPTTDYKGIGIRIQYERKEVDGKALPGGMILSVFPNTPAEQAGLRAGDFLLTLDGGKTSMISGIKGEPGTSIKVRYLPQGATTPKTVTVTRAIIMCSVYGCP
ncbi:hypothetical protein A3C20_03905 [Candidatus Kaiserbacteria bacterium RIFCSPHIGHO2_02_FULL_55_25]|uniref:PDZ domain-containing protein n=1 Tax=Candidatus Kaiserbacteria bacterium RIFCSPHIGHO2_02_FULL_55_25 TaxID=1798498 RepID=A0A1F6E7G1_9BACT|nr:MAG: hypothetical protein A3C20_03905 [Candidatus Kaiserbacteria bacterium RIFCSPHIGHO2_02_FULL_55_25]OGG83297.1 MAG: hypothetical protein A3A42_01820 [Candidatus Kaiserbacteria bacterium RIFCSPLOWO2_01_FULL_55_25]